MTLTLAAGNGGVRGTPKLIWVALIASLAVNVLIAGAIATFWWRAPGPMNSQGLNQHVLAFVRSLPPGRRGKLRQGIEAKRGEIRDQIQAIRKARTDAVQAMAAEPFDAASVEAKLNAVDERELALRRFNRPMIIDILAHMTPEERAAATKRLSGMGPPPR